MKKTALLLVILAITGCTSSPTIHRAPAPDIQLADVIRSSGSHQGQTVRWGGAVAEINNQADFSEVTVVQFPLNRTGKPIATADSDGRFIVRSDRFLDPLIYESGALITVIGTVSDIRQVTVGERVLEQPVVRLQDSYVWPDNYADRKYPYNPKHDARFIGYGYYGTGSYSP